MLTGFTIFGILFENTSCLQPVWQSLILREKVSKLITSFQIPEKVQVHSSLEFHFKVLILFPFIILSWLHLDRPHLLGTWDCQTFHFPLSTSFPAPAKGTSRWSGCLGPGLWQWASAPGSKPFSPWEQGYVPNKTAMSAALPWGGPTPASFYLFWVNSFIALEKERAFLTLI